MQNTGHNHKEMPVSFLQGAFSAQRYTTPKRAFAEEDVGRLATRSIYRTREGEDGVQVGWCGGEHELDGVFECAKNLRGEYLMWAFRVTKFAPPAGRVKAVYLTELKAVVESHGVEVPTREMKREAREAAQAKIEAEGRDGRYHKHTMVPVVWDGKTGQVWYGAASHANAGQFAALFAKTFGVELQAVTAGMISVEHSEVDAEPSFTDEPPVWCPDGYDWLGNEFALWCLWRHHATMGDVPVPSGRLTLSCPDGVHGTDTFAHEFPGKLPEVRKALQEGKCPRSFGLTLLEPDTIPLTLDPELWVVSGCKVPDLDGVRPGAERELARLDQCRAVFRQLDSLYGEFLDLRLGDGWEGVAEKINNWTGRVPMGV